MRIACFQPTLGIWQVDRKPASKTLEVPAQSWAGQRKLLLGLIRLEQPPPVGETGETAGTLFVL